ncbi:hypothetical protein TCAL_11637 [Tigriopus californicus]|uniref:Uncharacterized protein n=1 Tax=Tigriopus californicus TaxID=6832 RepID=A0A553PG10_TIGCA|nr:hypothetical protein TCAL_11637 [Tigriopus californicus]|eukprot:TCALIF_11637-PA protein Name:"Protein of unknown function" AED:0.00 eAED:0.00 QI:81/1/1/1/0.4/0.5/6/298/64
MARRLLKTALIFKILDIQGPFPMEASWRTTFRSAPMMCASSDWTLSYSLSKEPQPPRRKTGVNV